MSLDKLNLINKISKIINFPEKHDIIYKYVQLLSLNQSTNLLNFPEKHDIIHKCVQPLSLNQQNYSTLQKTGYNI